MPYCVSASDSSAESETYATTRSRFTRMSVGSSQGTPATVRCTVGAMTARSTLWSVAPLALATVVMLPRLLSPQFGLLDDGLTLQTGREVAGAWSSTLHLIPDTGRFFPAYWLVYSVIVAAVGVRPLAFFAVNLLLLAGLLALLARLVRLGGGTPRDAAIAAVVFALCGPAIETFYTLSKAEALQVTWIALALLATVAATREPRPQTFRRARSAGFVTVAAVAMLLANATKETALVVVPISLGWLALEWWWMRDRDAGVRFACTYAVINVVAAAAFAALRWSYAPLALAEGWYTRAYTLRADVSGPALFRIAAWLVRDFAFLLPLLAVAVVILARGRVPSPRPVLYAGVWMAGWLGVYVPWPATFEYYLLPFAFGAAALTGKLAGACWSLGRGPHSWATRRAAWSILAAGALLWFGATANAVGDARVQLAVDRANADLVDFLASLPRRSLVVLNTSVNEYLFELPMHLSEIKQRPDLVVEHVAHAGPRAPSPAAVVVATAEIANAPSPTVRIAIEEHGVRQHHTTLGALAGRGEAVYRSSQHRDVLEVAFHRLLCRVTVRPILDPAYCPGERGAVYRGTFSYGWQVHRLGRTIVDRVERRNEG